MQAFIAREVVDACTVPGRHELPPATGVSYVGFVDASGGSSDSFTLAVAHGELRDGQVFAVLDVLREERPPRARPGRRSTDPQFVASDLCVLSISKAPSATFGECGRARDRSSESLIS